MTVTRTMAKVIVITAKENIPAKATFCLRVISTFHSKLMGIEMTDMRRQP